MRREMPGARLLVLSLACGGLASLLGCQLPAEWRPLSESCRAELAEIIVYAKVLAVHEESRAPSTHRHPWYPHERAGDGLLYAAEVELLCDQAWGSMLEVPAGSRLNVTGLGYLSCQSHTVLESYSYIFFLRMDENYNILPHGVNYQDAIFPDTQENRHLFSSLFQFSNCSSGHTLYSTPNWEHQEDSRLFCSTVQQLLSEEEVRVGRLQERVAELERRNTQLRDRLRKLKRSLRKARHKHLGPTQTSPAHRSNAITSPLGPPHHTIARGL
ncbi:hypothetical protein P4O66_014251 [Electrophorus voltai]|uniref:Coiled-coil domain containing 3a n=1 Tax=Electrophorus voltai TaxID=2609070 RepID=A0AAD9DRC2_9TELE|nr:hypothetical protein P4O66_014251 [Electrophorus voltai]